MRLAGKSALVATVSLLLASAALAQMQMPTGDEAGGIAACAACSGVGLLFVLLPIAITIGIAVWMYKDAQKRNDPNAILWLIVGLVGSVIGLIVYLIVRSQKSSSPPPPTV